MVDIEAAGCLRHKGFAVNGRLLMGLVAAVLALAGCGGGGSGSAAPTPIEASPVPVAAAPNVVSIVVDRGTDGSAIDIPFVTVTVCEPGTQNCRSIDHVLVDTASHGLRVTAAALGGLALPGVTNAAGAGIAECAQFASGFTWGSVRRADVRLSGKSAANLPIQVVGDTASPFAAVPAACSRTGGDLNVGAGANGILGVGMFTQDCGSACVSGTAPGLYFACPTGGCSGSSVPLALQVANPVPFFTGDNNGVAVVMPAVPLGGVGPLSGALIFGIDTQPNNQLGGATVYRVNSRGNFTTTYKGTSFPESFIDSGSNGIFFPDSSIPQCQGFYCPPEPLTLSAVNTSAAGVAGTVTFFVESVTAIAPGSSAAHLGANAGIPGFDWGLPFFFGRTVFVAMSGASTSKGPGPFWAY
jgi:hypothetical protein